MFSLYTFVPLCSVSIRYFSCLIETFWIPVNSIFVGESNPEDMGVLRVSYVQLQPFRDFRSTESHKRSVRSHPHLLHNLNITSFQRTLKLYIPETSGACNGCRIMPCFFYFPTNPPTPFYSTPFYSKNIFFSCCLSPTFTCIVS